jgi:hypothetical protein
LLSQPGDLGDTVDQRQRIRDAQGRAARAGRQVSNVVEPEVQDGLIPVIITL